ncbi:MAG: NAD-dependent epimerase/dehydratase family protein [Blastocatellia bacterium]|nr:NAD-dependent epimerase/dehydratase family protein [Blastocatellia bacterium]
MRVFVTGGTGFIGGNLISELVSRGAEVRALARKGADRRTLEGLSFELVEGDLNDPALLQKAMQGCDWAFHVAAMYSLARRDKEAIFKSNVDGTKNILAAAQAAGVKRIVHTSSVAAIGVPPKGAIGDESTQTSLPELISAYKQSKFLSEQLALQAAKEGAPVVIVNPSTPIGPRDVKPTPTGDIVLRFLRREMPMFVHTGLNLVDVRDVVAGHLLAAEKGRIGERYILGNHNVTFKEMLDLLEKITGLPAPTKAIPHWVPIMVGYVDELLLSPLLGRRPVVEVDSARMAAKPMYYTSAKAVRELGLPQRPIEQALRDAVVWFQQNGYV